jgi:hypothetical protein
MKKFMVYFTLNYLRRFVKVSAATAQEAKDYVKASFPLAKNVRARPSLLG